MPTPCVKGSGFHRWDLTVSRLHDLTRRLRRCVDLVPRCGKHVRGIVLQRSGARVDMCSNIEAS